MGRSSTLAQGRRSQLGRYGLPLAKHPRVTAACLNASSRMTVRMSTAGFEQAGYIRFMQSIYGAVGGIRGTG